MNTPTQNTEHTPSPWRVEKRWNGAIDVVAGDKNVQFVCSLAATEPALSRNMADGAIIARAPALLAENARLRSALELAQATIYRLATQHGPFNSAQGTLDVINAALSAVERGQK